MYDYNSKWLPERCHIRVAAIVVGNKKGHPVLVSFNTQPSGYLESTFVVGITQTYFRAGIQPEAVGSSYIRIAGQRLVYIGVLINAWWKFT